MATFDEYLKLGNIGERIVEKYLQNNLGWWTIPSYLYQGDMPLFNAACGHHIGDANEMVRGSIE